MKTEQSKKILELNLLGYKIPNGKVIFDQLSLDVFAGEHIGILGRNGVGKTTLLDLILGFKNPYKGSIKIMGEDPIFSDRHFLCETAYVSQDAHIDLCACIKNFMEVHAANYPDFDFTKASSLFDQFEIDQSQQIGGLSKGYLNLVQLILQIARNPKLMLIDEVTAVLDPENRYAIHKILRQEIKSNNSTIIIATNIAEELINNVDKVLFIENKGFKQVTPKSIDELFKVA